MKQLSILYFLLLSNTVLAQEKAETKPESERVRFKLGIVYSPDYSYRISKNTSIYKWTKELRDNDDKPLFGYTTGLSAVVYVNKNIGIETGVYHTKKGEKGQVMRSIYDIHSSYQWYAYDYTYSYKYLEIPLKFTYIFSRKGISYFVSVGMGAEIMLKPETKLIYRLVDFSRTTNHVLDKEYYQKMNFSSIVGLGIGYDITKKLAMSFEPTYTQLLTPVYFQDFTSIYPRTYGSDGVKEYPFSIGCRVGIHYLIY